MAQLTPGEYEGLPQEVKDALANLVPHPRHDRKSAAYERQKGAYLNGDPNAMPSGPSGNGTVDW